MHAVKSIPVVNYFSSSFFLISYLLSLTALISFLLQLFSLFLAWLEEETNPVGVVVHGEVRQPGASVCVHNNLVSYLHIEDDILTSHGVLVVVLVVLVKDGGNLLTVPPDGQQGLLVVVGGNVEHKEVGATGGAGEDASVNIQTTSNIAVGTIEGQVLLTATIIGLASVGVEVDTKGLS